MSIFADKLDGLASSIDRAFQIDINLLTQAIAACANQTAFAIGSGGSIVTAHVLAACRGELGHGATIVGTPMDFAMGYLHRSPMPVWIFTAGGTNPDILAAYEAAARTEAPTIDVLTSDPKSAIVERGANNPRARVHVAPILEPKDGFLATHSLVSAATLLLRAADTVAETKSTSERRARVNDIATRVLSLEHRSNIQRNLEEIGRRDVLLLLHDPLLVAAAVLVETSSWESGLCAIQRTDFRNFAHGRHVWLDRHGDRTGILALTTEQTRSSWQEIEKLIPRNIPRFTLDFRYTGRQTILESVLEGFVLVEATGLHRCVDPAHPGVSEFGRAVFALTSLLQDVEEREVSHSQYGSALQID